MAKIVLGGGWKGDGPSWYRVEMPARWLRARGHNVKTVYNRIAEAEADLADCQLFLFQRTWHPSAVLGVSVFQSRGVRTVYELDDDIWRIPKWNPLAKNFDVDHVQGMEGIMRSVDEMIVSTSKLAESAVRINPNVTVIGNGVALDLIPPEAPPTERPPKVRIGWAGSGTHQQDLELVVPALKQLLAKRTDVTIVMMGEGFPADLPIERHPWTHPKDYYGCLRDLELDIFLAPLSRHPFNESKTSIKVQEAGAMGWPVVASDYGPYRCVQPGVTGYKIREGDTAGWLHAIESLCKAPDARQRMGRGGRLWVEKHGSMDVTGPQWERVLTKTLEERYGKGTDPKVEREPEEE